MIIFQCSKTQEEGVSGRTLAGKGRSTARFRNRLVQHGVDPFNVRTLAFSGIKNCGRGYRFHDRIGISNV